MKTCRPVIALGMLLFAAALPAVETTWTYSVQLSATAHPSPPRIELNWVVDHIPAENYVVHRKGIHEPAWGEGVMLPAHATSYTDEAVEIGARYEYQVIKHAAVLTAYGYVAAGIRAPLVEDRGKALLVVDQSIAGPLGPDLARFEQDLVGDGWTVVRLTVARDEQPAAIRHAIRAEYAADPERVEAVILLGHVPVVRAGNLNVDAHQARPMPADVFYGEMDGEWTDADANGVYDQSLLPSDVELQVGRIDFAHLPGKYAASPYPNEIELLRRYLGKNHAYRHAIVRPAQRALIGDAVGDGNGQAYSASAYRNFAALLGAGQIVHAKTSLDTPPEERWFARLLQEDFVWAFGSGAGSDLTVSHLGTHGIYNDLWATDFVDHRPKAAFYLMLGSWFVDWSASDNLLRSTLAAQDLGLAAAWCGRPHLFFHHMGSGDTIGAGIRLSQNNTGVVYQNQVQRQLRGIHVALLGDPTLRLHVIAPPTDARAEASGGDVVVTWTPSPDPVAGYHVYRQSGGRFVRITEALVEGAQYRDVDRPFEGAKYMVRAVALQNGPSGSYVNASQGAFTPGAGGAGEPNEVVWFDDALPEGATGFATSNDRWNWVTSNPRPFSGAAAHQSELASGLHLHFFAGASPALAVNAGDTLFTYVYLDPDHPPRQIVVAWHAEHWEHRAYWGESLIAEGAEGGPGRRYMGPLPERGRWIRLEVPAHAVGLEGKRVTGMGFNLFDGRATWDRAGKQAR